MKSRAIAAVSVLVNLTLLLLVLKQPGLREPAVSQPANVRPRAIAQTVIQTVTNTKEILLPGKVVKRDWRMVESADYKEYIARLRSIGCPEETIRDIIIADVNKLYASKWRGLVMPAGGVKYWESWDDSAEHSNPKLAGQRRELEIEKRDLIKELLGVDIDQEKRKLELRWTWLDREDHLMDFLPADKRNRIASVRDAAREQVQAITDRAQGKLTVEDRTEIARIRASATAETRKVLSKEEFDQYVLRVSATANEVRSSLIGFDPSEKEYQDIFWAQSAFDKPFKYYTGDPQDAAYLKKRAEAAAAMDDRVRNALGEERYAEYQKTKDSTYRDLFRFAQQMDLPRDVASKAYKVKKLAEAQALKLRSNQNLAPEQQRAALQAIQTETQSTLNQLMGPEAFKSYESRRGYWIRGLGR